MMELLERGVVALEKLNEEPVMHVESGPPVCPHCERVNPIVRVSEATGEGPLGEFLIQARCLACQKSIYAIPLMWDCVGTTEEAREVNEQRKERLGYS